MPDDVRPTGNRARAAANAAQPSGEPPTTVVPGEGIREGKPQDVVGGSPGDADLKQVRHELRGARSEDD
jgi:hypothetical protein